MLRPAYIFAAISLNDLSATMSVNALPPHQGISPFELAPGEIIRYLSASTRQSLAINLRNPLNDINVRIKVGDGSLYVTNRRFVFVTASQGDVSSFVVDFSRARSLRFSHSLESPWFGPNYWQFRFFSPPDGSCSGFPKGEWFDGKAVFKDGGVVEFVSVVDDVLNDAVNNSQIDEELPRYSEQ
ncbi:hypothetical protein PUMCH_004365 [Australozyma saopauloensis]|uniref:Uncharacterized protein n=1 Tax=Australozyma saopauloensis TaxID=291208 RepID=A0AAX4HF00_9ASCO|nr:hypothetical protein PUMCH_004365 [[Candida] saopauloensis]